jgi:hypothetical protein
MANTHFEFCVNFFFYLSTSNPYFMISIREPANPLHHQPLHSIYLGASNTTHRYWSLLGALSVLALLLSPAVLPLCLQGY